MTQHWTYYVNGLYAGLGLLQTPQNLAIFCGITQAAFIINFSNQIYRFSLLLGKNFYLDCSCQGIPQASMLSSTPFSLFFAGIKSEENSCNCVGLYEDDINFYLRNLEKFATEHKLIFNPTKSVSSIFVTMSLTFITL